MKKWMLAFVVWFGLVSGAHAQIPVTDVASLTQQIQQVVSWGQQLQQMKSQLQQQQQMYQSMSGGRGLGSLLNNPTLRMPCRPTGRRFIRRFKMGAIKD